MPIAISLPECSGCEILVIIVLTLMALGSEEARPFVLLIAGGLLALAIVGGVLGFFVVMAWPVGLYLIIALLLLGIFHYIKEKSFGVGYEFWPSLAKSIRDALACISIGLGIVALAQILLRIFFRVGSDETVMLIEDGLYVFAKTFKDWTGYATLLKVVLPLLLIAVIFRMVDMLVGISKIWKLLSNIGLVLVTMSWFSFFSLNTIIYAKVEWTALRRTETERDYEQLRRAQAEILAIGEIEFELKALSSEQRKFLTIVLNNARLSEVPTARPSSRPTSPPKPGSPPKLGGPTNPKLPLDELVIRYPPPSSTGGAPSLSDYGRTLGEAFEPNLREPQMDDSALTESVKSVEKSLHNPSASRATVDDVNILREEAARVATETAYKEKALAELTKSTASEILGIGDANVLKPFVEALFDAVSEKLIKGRIPVGALSLESARAWIAKMKPVPSQAAKVPWRQKLASFFLSPEELMTPEELTMKGWQERVSLPNPRAVIATVKIAGTMHSDRIGVKGEGVDVKPGEKVLAVEEYEMSGMKRYRVQTLTGKTGWISGFYLEPISSDCFCALVR